VDRHTHLEGSLDPQWVRREAARRGLGIPDGTEAFWRGETQGFEAFISTFLFACSFLNSGEAVRTALEAALDRLPPPMAGETRGIDLWISPHWLVRERKQLSLTELWSGIEQGLALAAQRGTKVAVVLDAVNHLGPQHGHEVLDLVLGELPSWVIGFSTGGMERVPFRDWAPVFARARKAGLRLATHAGENGPAEGIREAILEAGVERIVHAVKAVEDPSILELLAERRIPVDVCLTSNRALLPGLGPHPLPRFLQAGIRCGLGTDDPGVMRCDVASEWEGALALGLSAESLALLGKFSVEDAWSLQIGT